MLEVCPVEKVVTLSGCEGMAHIWYTALDHLFPFTNKRIKYQV
jgi:hypothetical protein